MFHSIVITAMALIAFVLVIRPDIGSNPIYPNQYPSGGYYANEKSQERHEAHKAPPVTPVIPGDSGISGYNQ